MRHLTLIRIKNKEFDYRKYGLAGPYFTLDISQSVNYTRGVGFTQYALLDGTTRIDNMSREPSSISFQGKLAEVRAGGSNANFVQETVSRNRLQNQMDLLEAIRDQGIFLDFITDERTYRDHLIQSVNFGKARIGEIDVSLTIKEVITFGDKIDIQNLNKSNDMSLYEQSIILDDFYMRDINSDMELVDEINRIITSSILSTPFIITLGSVSINADAILPSVTYWKQKTKTSFPSNSITMTVSDTNKVAITTSSVVVPTGVVAEGYYLQLTLPTLTKDYNFYNTRLIKHATGAIEEFPEAKSYISIILKKGKDNIYSVRQGSILMEPKYSSISGGIHPLGYTGSGGEVISTAKYGMNFIRKLKYDRYTVAPNLLGLDSRGYLFNASYEYMAANRTVLQPTLVYINPVAWKKIREEIKRVWLKSNYFSSKELKI